jgi:signal recognition particle receptor subunit beta
MVFFNASTRELTAKIVYYGPGLGGKTTNLRVLHERLEPRTAGELVALSTETDRTIYFDLLPVELGDIKGYRIRFQLATVPGQTAFNETRRVVLKGADGIVFVADSQWTLLPKNLESWQSLKENLAANGLAFDAMPVVIQYNKRDLPDILSIEAMQEALGSSTYPHVEAVATEGRGVTETFKLISKLTFLDLLRRLQGRPTPEAAGAVVSGSLATAGRSPAARESGPRTSEEPADAERRRPLSLVRGSGPDTASDPPPTLAGEPRAPEDTVEESPFPEAAAPLNGASTAVPLDIETRLQSLETRIAESRDAVAHDGARTAAYWRTIESLRTWVESIQRAVSELSDRAAAFEQKLDEINGRLAGETAVLERRMEERIRALDEQTSAFTRNLEELRRNLSDKVEQARREPEDLRLQLAPLLEKQVRREADENWTAEIERLRQALAESLEDLSERVRRAVRG